MDGSPAKVTIPTLESQRFPTNPNLNIQYGSHSTLKCDDCCSIISYSVSLYLYELVASHFYSMWSSISKCVARSYDVLVCKLVLRTGVLLWRYPAMIQIPTVGGGGALWECKHENKEPSDAEVVTIIVRASLWHENVNLYK